MDRKKFTEWYENSNGPIKYLISNWPPSKLAKFIAGYERWNPKTYNEVTEEELITPEVLKMFGFPLLHTNIEPTPKGAANREWAISLPDYIVNSLKEKFGDSIIIGPANSFGLYNAKSGLIKDGIKDTYVLLPSSDKWVYLMKKS